MINPIPQLYETKDRAAQKIIDGKVGIFPVDTVYGIVASATQPKAVSRFYGLKQRTDKPGTLIAGHIHQLVDLGIDSTSIERASAYWPNPTSVVLPTPPNLDYLSLGKQTLAIRIPADEELRSILIQTGPIITTSANRPGEPTVVAVDQAVNIFGDSVDFYVDGGDYTNRQPSTVIILSDSSIEVLRDGAGPTIDRAT